ncbi:MAG: proline dehydrogenase family protein [Flavobacteriales bacterium]|nr:proline dehydrogenase family protein [Flavobacteriales bacterium]
MPPPATAAPPQQLPDLRDTRTAFAHKSNAELWRAYWLFKVIGNPTVSGIGGKLTQFALNLRLPVKGLIKGTIFSQFCGGETIEESLGAATRLAKSGVGTILDYSVEGKDGDEAALDHTVEETVRTIGIARERNDIPFCVFKPTGIGRLDIWARMSDGRILSNTEREEWLRVVKRMETICRTAADANVRILVDAEESWMQPAIDDITDRMMAQHNRARAIVYNTVQHYRHDRLDFLKASFAKAEQGHYMLGVKLVRGAYMEKERARAVELGYRDPIHADKASVDKDYDEALRFTAEHIDRISVVVGTHNEDSTLLMAKLMGERNIARNDDRICFAQLLGMSDNLSFNMAAAGYRVAKYVPYGPVREVMPYLLRRAAENTSARGQSGRELTLIALERKRRKA